MVSYKGNTVIAVSKVRARSKSIYYLAKDKTGKTIIIRPETIPFLQRLKLSIMFSFPFKKLRKRRRNK